MRYKVLKCTDKTLEQYGALKDIVVKDVEGNEITGTIWKKQKDGTDYPNFDTIIEGAEFEANAWTNPTSGKVSFFAPKLNSGANRGQSGARTAQITKAMEKKEQSIEKFQDNKEFSIKTSSTMRDAVLIVTARDFIKTATDEEIEREITKWRNWLLKNWEVNLTDDLFF